MSNDPLDLPVNEKAPRAYRRQTNAKLRSREWLEEAEVKQIRAAAGKVGRHGHRDSTMVWIAYRHGLRCTELVESPLGPDRPERGDHVRPQSQGLERQRAHHGTG